MAELIKYGEEGYARQQSELPIDMRNYWAYLPNGDRIDTRTNNFEIACQVTAIQASGLNNTTLSIKAFPSQRDYKWNGSDWVAEPLEIIK